MQTVKHLRWLLILPALMLASPPPVESRERPAGTPFGQRLNRAWLSAASRDAAALRARSPRPAADGPLRDYRTVMHVHSALSHDSRGSAAEIAAAARAAGVDAVFMTEHPEADRRWLKEGLRGELDGVTFVSGAELSSGLLLWGEREAAWEPGEPIAGVLKAMRGPDVLAALAHTEARSEAEWNLPGLAAAEIYNCHADAGDSSYETFLKDLAANPLKALTILAELKKYPLESYAAIFDEQSAVLAAWDSRNSREGAAPLITGLAGNDAHQNTGISLEQDDQGLVLRDGLGKIISRPAGLPLLSGPPSGVPLIRHLFDPYEISFRYVSTHLLAAGRDEKSLLDALRKGRAYVCFDWLGDPVGFALTLESRGGAALMGDTISGDRAVLRCELPAEAEMRLVRNGTVIDRVSGDRYLRELSAPGVYRVEAWVEAAGEQRPWIYSNPIRLQAP